MNSELKRLFAIAIKTPNSFILYGLVKLSDNITYRLVGKKRTHIWVVATPKSGSTWISAILEKSLGWHTSILVPTYGQREQEVDPRTLLKTPLRKNLISVHSHTRYSSATHEFIQRGNVSIILQIRNIFDWIVSLHDHIEKGLYEIPFGFVDAETWLGLDADQKLDFVIDLLAPWYINFYTGWLSNLENVPTKIVLSKYEDLVADPIAHTEHILGTLGVVPNSIELPSKNVNTRFNKGILNRGQTMLSAAQKDRVRQMASFYPQVDFSHIGL